MGRGGPGQIAGDLLHANTMKPQRAGQASPRSTLLQHPEPVERACALEGRLEGLMFGAAVLRFPPHGVQRPLLCRRGAQACRPLLGCPLLLQGRGHSHPDAVHRGEEHRAARLAHDALLQVAILCRHQEVVRVAIACRRTSSRV